MDNIKKFANIKYSTKFINLNHISLKSQLRKREIWLKINKKRFSYLENCNYNINVKNNSYNNQDLNLFFEIANNLKQDFENNKDYLLKLLIKIIINSKSLEDNFLNYFEKIYQKLNLNEKAFIFNEISSYKIENIKILHFFIQYVKDNILNNIYYGLMIFNKYFRQFHDDKIYIFLFSSEKDFLNTMLNSLNNVNLQLQYIIWSFIYNIFSYYNNSNIEMIFSFFLEINNIQILFDNIKNNLFHENLILLSISFIVMIKLFECYNDEKKGIFNNNLISLIYCQKILLIENKNKLFLKSKKLEEFCDILINIFNNII